MSLLNQRTSLCVIWLMGSEAKGWCQLLKDVKRLPLNDAEGTIEVASKLFPGSCEVRHWRDHEVHAPLFLDLF